MLAPLPHGLPQTDTNTDEETGKKTHQPTQTLSSAPAILHEEERLRSHIQYYANRGRQYHNKGALKKAADSFAECIRISKLLLLSNNYKTTELSGIELLFMASHNMAACCNQLREARQGEAILRELYTQVVSLCDSRHYSQSVRLEALSVLDKSLFSLASQMAYMGKASGIQELIAKTEAFADSVSKSLQTT
ncbi:MAG: hypothetical protein ACRBCI_07055, partial [Cellvibrionaceae bacterium]